MAAYDNVALPGAPNIATAGNYAQQLFNMGQGLRQAYQSGQEFDYQQRQRNLFQNPDAQQALQDAIATGDYSKILGTVGISGGAPAVEKMIPLIQQQRLIDAYRQRMLMPWPDPNNPAGAPSPYSGPSTSAPLPAPTSATGPTGITGRPPASLTTTVPADSGGDTFRTAVANIAGYDSPVEISSATIDRLAREFGGENADSRVPPGVMPRLASRVDALVGRPSERAAPPAYPRIPYATPEETAGLTPAAVPGVINRGPGVAPPPATPTMAPAMPTTAPTAPTAPPAPPGPPLSPAASALRDAGLRRVAGGAVPGATTVPSGPPLTDTQQQTYITNLRRAGTRLLQQAEPILPGEQPDPARTEQAKQYFHQADELEKELIERRKLTDDERTAARLGMTLPQYQAQKAATEKAGGLRGEQFGRLATAIAEKASTADTMTGHLKVMHSTLESPDLFTGPGHEPVEYLRKAYQNLPLPQGLKAALGITANTAPNEALRKVTAANVLNQMTGMRDDASAIGGSGGALRVAQMDLMIKAAQSPDSSIPALRLLTELGDRAVVQDKVIGQMAREYIRRSPTHTLDEAFQDQMSKWYEAHPLLSPQEEAEIKYLSAPTLPSSVKTEADARAWMKKMQIPPGSVARLNRSTLAEFQAAEKAGRPYSAQYIDLPK